MNPGVTFATGLIKKKEDLKDIVSSIEKYSRKMNTLDLTPDGWSFGSGDDKKLLQKIQDNGVSLDTLVKGSFFYGVKTGLNEAFVIDEATRERLILEDKKSAEIIKPWLRGRDVKKWSFRTSDLHLITIRYGSAESVKQYPSIYGHLKKFEADLRARGQCEGTKGKPGSKQHHWLELDNNPTENYLKQFLKPKIIYADIAKHMRAAYDTSGAYCGNTMYILPTDDLSILGILNSTLFDWYARHKFQPLGDPWNGGRLRFIAQFMKIFPMPPTSANRDKLAGLVKNVLDKKNDNPDANVSSLEKEIDSEVYKLYNLDSAEIGIIESATKDAQKKAA